MACLGGFGRPPSKSSTNLSKEFNISNAPFLPVSLKLDKTAKPVTLVNNKGQFLPRPGEDTAK